MHRARRALGVRRRWWWPLTLPEEGLSEGGVWGAMALGWGTLVWRVQTGRVGLVHKQASAQGSVWPGGPPQVTRQTRRSAGKLPAVWGRTEMRPIQETARGRTRREEM